MAARSAGTLFTRFYSRGGDFRPDLGRNSRGWDFRPDSGEIPEAGTFAPMLWYIVFLNKDGRAHRLNQRVRDPGSCSLEFVIYFKSQALKILMFCSN